MQRPVLQREGAGVSEAAITIGARGRSLSFTASALLITMLCTLMILVSRVAQLGDGATIRGVHAVIEEAPRRAAAPAPQAPRRAGIAVIAPDGAPTPTPIPVDREMLARALACFDRLNRERPADCPREALEQDYGDGERTRRAYDPSPPRVRVALDPLPMGISPPCNVGVHATTMGGDGVGGGACFHVGRDPPPPSRSAEEICEAGHVGPCRPPPFRPEDVVRLAHTQ